MRDQVITDTVRVQINYFMDNNNASNVFHVGYSGTVGETELDALETEIDNWLTTGWKPIASEDWSVAEIILMDMGSLTGIRKSYPISPAIVGGLANEAMPANVTIAVKASVGHRGRGVNGRVFWIGLSENQVTANNISPAFATSVLAALNDLDTGIALITPYTGLVVPHLVVNKVPVNPAGSEPVLNFVLSDTSIDTQKDRLPFHKKRKRPTAA